VNYTLWKVIFPFFRLLFSSLAKMQLTGLQDEFCKHLGCPGATIIHECGNCLYCLSMPPACTIPELSETAILLVECDTSAAMEGTT
jgi:hypothetical protein